MSVYAVNTNGTVVAGVLVFPFLSDSGQINTSEAFKADLEPYNFSGEDNVTLAWNIAYDISARIFVDDYTTVSALEGYPDRYRFGQFSLLFGNQAYPPFFIDRIDWKAPGKYPAWYITGSIPYITFYEEEPTEATTFDQVVNFSTTAYGFFGTGSLENPATQFSWELVRNIGMTVNFSYHAGRIDFANNPDPAPSIFWQWN